MYIFNDKMILPEDQGKRVYNSKHKERSTRQRMLFHQ